MSTLCHPAQRQKQHTRPSEGRDNPQRSAAGRINGALFNCSRLLLHPLLQPPHIRPRTFLFAVAPRANSLPR